MKSKFRSKFDKDISKIKNQKILDKLNKAIINVEQAELLTEINNLKKLKGSKTAYRIPVGDYRIGIFIEKGVGEFTRFLHRKDIYKYFP